MFVSEGRKNPGRNLTAGGRKAAFTLKITLAAGHPVVLVKRICQEYRGRHKKAGKHAIRSAPEAGSSEVCSVCGPSGIQIEDNAVKSPDQPIRGSVRLIDSSRAGVWSELAGILGNARNHHACGRLLGG